MIKFGCCAGSRHIAVVFVVSSLVTIWSAQGTSANPDVRTVAPTEIDQPLNNPYMGWGLWAGPRYFDGRRFTLEYNTSGFGDDAPLFNWVLIDWMWSDLEPQEGQYYWKDLDTVMNYWAARGKQIELRVWVTDDPGWNGAPGNEVCPEWLWRAGAQYHEYVGEGKSKKREPDYVDPSYERVYLPKVRKFLTALAERYDKPDSPIVLWGAMGYGQWGEWHTLWSHYPWPNREVKHAVLAKIASMYADIFRVKQLSVAYVQDHDLPEVRNHDDFLYRQALDVAISKGFALARHGFIDGFDTWDKMTMQRYWKENPMWAEGNWSYTDVRNQKTHGTLDENIDVMLEWHSNYGHFYMDSESYKRAMRDGRGSFARGLESGGLGYRLVPKKVSWPEELPAGRLFLIRQTWVNRNVGRLYLRHPLKVYLTDPQGNEKFSEADRAFDETFWVQGESYPMISVFHLPKGLAPGVYDVRIALVDGSGKPTVRLAIQGEDPLMRYKLGSIRITEPDFQVPCDKERCP